MEDIDSRNDCEDDDCEREQECVESEMDVNCLKYNKLELLELLKVGTIHNNLDIVFELFKRYAFLLGFPAKKRTSKKDCNGVQRWITFSCGREGTPRSTSSNCLKPRPSSKTGCKVKIRITLERDEKWKVTSSFLDHNHPLSPSKSRFYKCNRNIKPSVKRALELGDRAGIRPCKNFGTIVEDAHGYENITATRKDCQNYLAQVRRLRLGKGDVDAVQRYFLKMQSQSADFFYCMDHDEEGRLKNVFWADGKSRKAYKEFGDVVAFDTTYLTNKYEMPFAPFVGVNHHGHTILFGCGLISNEDTNTFIWLFQTWLACMDGCYPQGIITDQCKAMQNAILEVFPNTRHRWCLWHILKKLPIKFGSNTQKDQISSTLQCLVYDSQDPGEFKEGWIKMLDKYGLHEHKWLTKLYGERHLWVPIYLKTNFWAGMSTTQRSESVNAFFDGYVHAKTTLSQFVEQYGRALRDKAQKEADFRSYAHKIPCVTRFNIEKQAQQVYTTEKFKVFQEELIELLYCKEIHSYQDDMFTVHDIRSDIVIGDGNKKRMVYKVYYNQTSGSIHCSCFMFECSGMLCRHSILVLQDLGVDFIPEQYILRRWRNDVARAHTKVPIGYDDWDLSENLRTYDRLSRAFTELADLSCDDDRRCERYIEWVENEKKSIPLFKESVLPSMSGVNVGNWSNANANEETLLDPLCVKRKGRPRSKRLESTLYTKSKKKNVSTKKKNKKSDDPQDVGIHVTQESRHYDPQDVGIHVTQESHHYDTQDVGLHATQESHHYDPQDVGLHAIQESHYYDPQDIRFTTTPFYNFGELLRQMHPK